MYNLGNVKNKERKNDTMPDLVRQFVHSLFLGKTDEQTA